MSKLALADSHNWAPHLRLSICTRSPIHPCCACCSFSLGSPVYYLASHQIDAERCRLFFFLSCSFATPVEAWASRQRCSPVLCAWTYQGPPKLHGVTRTVCLWPPATGWTKADLQSGAVMPAPPLMSGWLLPGSRLLPLMQHCLVSP